ncbi:MAG TPA: EAL domain-containing protein [Acidimicrobiales bacterium]|nr:EAL domain-containing protein [Acidimicrobiales bacterium]
MTGRPLDGEVRRVLLVEDRASDRRLITEMLVDSGVAREGVIAAGSLAAARELVASAAVDCVLLDLSLPDASGLEGVRTLSAALPGVPLVVVSGHPADSLVYAAMAEGADEFVCKGDLTAAALADALRRARQRRRGSARAQAQFESSDLSLEAVDAPTVVVDTAGVIVGTNHAWVRSALANGASLSQVDVGVNYLTVCDMAVGDHSEVAASVAAGIRAVLHGEVARYIEDYPFGTQWFTVRVSAVGGPGQGAVISHLEITALKEAERRLERDLRRPASLVDRSAPIFALLAADGTAGSVSGLAAELLGLAGRPPGSHAFAGLAPEQRAQAEACLRRALRRPGVREQLILTAFDGDRRARTLDLGLCNLLDDPSVAAVVLSGSDITGVHRKLVTRHLETRILRRLPAAVVVSDDGGSIVYWNDRAAELFGHRSDEVLGSAIDDLGVWPAWSVVRSATDGASAWVGEHLARRKDWREVPVQATLERIEDPATGFTGVVGTSTDITERRRLEARLAFEARHDPLTGLLNRRALVDRLSAALARAADRSPGVAVIYIDLDNFKEVNDTLNHHVGDEVLKTASALISSVLRPGDVLARLGGDEFVVCAEACASIDDAVALAGRVLEAVGVPFRHDHLSISIGASIGVAFSSEGSTAEELLRQADIAMYEAKESGKGRAIPFDETLRNQLRRHRSVTTELSSALDRDQIVTYFQPQVDMTSGALVGFEALVRWQHPTRGIVPPDRFVPIAEESELITRLGAKVIGDACRALADFDRGGRPGLQVAVNVSGRQLLAPSFADEVLGILAATGVDAHQLCIEITESALAETELAARVLARVRAAGITIAIDDFGTGYSSLSRLQGLPLDDLKIDRSFVARMLDDAGSHAIVSAVVGLARSLGLGIVAEGVEHHRQVAELLALGCTRAQGYLWSRPVAFAEAAAMLGHPPWARGARSTDELVSGARPRRPGRGLPLGASIPYGSGKGGWQ